MKIFRVHCVESERGWGQEHYHVDFATELEAQEYAEEINSQNTSLVAPDFYVQANRIEKVEISDSVVSAALKA